jgi:hypothetical protein
MAGIFNDPFHQGFFLGVLFMLALTPFFFWLGVWSKKVRAFFKPQPVIQTTNQTPIQVLGQSMLYVALLILIMLLAFFTIQALRQFTL